MAIFFMNFGISISGSSLQQYFIPAIMASILLIIFKFLIFFLTIDRFKFTPKTSFTASVNMTQVSEFGLILTSLAITEGFIQSEVSGFISLVAILTMGTSAYLIRFRDRLEEQFKPLLDLFESEEKTDLEVEKLEDHAVIIGYDEMAERTCSKLAEEYDIMVIDQESDKTEKLAESDYTYVYGDFKHGEIRQGANLEEAEFILSFSEQKQVNNVLLEERKEETVVFVKASNFEDASEFYDLGADYVMIENILAGNRISEYIEIYLEDKEVFKQEINSELQHITGDEEFLN